jgi:tetratricopeptide (TPR) repeat protein
MILFMCSSCGQNQKNNEKAPSGRSPMKDYFLNQGALFLNNHDFMKALMLADSAAKYADNKDDIYFFKGDVYYELGRLNQAIQAFIYTLEINPNYLGAHKMLGKIAFQQEDYTKAAKHYKRELTLNETSVSYCDLGRAYTELGIADSARMCFYKSIDLDNNFSDSYLYLAKLEGAEGNINKSFQAAARACELDKNNMEYQYVYNVILVQMDRGSEAVLSLKKVVDNWPWHPGAHYNLGKALIQSGKKLQGEKFLDKSKAAIADQNKIKHLENIIRDLQNDPYAYKALAIVLQNVGRHKEALHTYKIALYLDPANYEIWNEVAKLYLQQNDTVSALNTYNIIVDKNPNLAEVWLDMGIIYDLSNQKNKAEEAWSTALQLEPNNVSIINHLNKLK